MSKAKSAAAGLPESEQSRPKHAGREDGPFDALRERLGVTEQDREKLRAEPLAEGEEYMKHAAFERMTDAEGSTRYSTPTDCGGSLRILDDSGTLWPVRCDACGFEVGVQVQKIDPARLTERRLARAGIPEHFAGKEFDRTEPAQASTLAACREWLRGFKRDPLPAVALYGKAGRGKSHLLSLIVRVLVENYGVDAVYRSAAELFAELQTGVGDGSFEPRWKRVLHVPVLALDDLGAGRSTEWRTDLITALFDYRYSRELPTVIATNVPPGGWERAFGERTNSRMRGLMVPLLLDGPDRRAQGVQQTLGDSA